MIYWRRFTDVGKAWLSQQLQMTKRIPQEQPQSQSENHSYLQSPTLAKETEIADAKAKNVKKTSANRFIYKALHAISTASSFNSHEMNEIRHRVILILMTT